MWLIIFLILTVEAVIVTAMAESIVVGIVMALAFIAYLTAIYKVYIKK